MFENISASIELFHFKLEILKELGEDIFGQLHYGRYFRMHETKQ